ncbi:MAG: hypothetical protein A3F16_08555 [Deltaproteobacteria bacterium RIFCSPHIGHO2_12_FULL_43_9]|nr:MAG: hypothetical protein A3F16_08555 [Deltaproteobacteria bacterium RIFCSPHIGHO2_12_FULL_43_9]
MENKFKINIPVKKISAFCEKWKITELSLFGSILRKDFSKASDIDVLVSFTKDHPWNLFDVVRMEAELSKILGRSVDFVVRSGLEQSKNDIRRKEIFSTARVVYAKAA